MFYKIKVENYRTCLCVLSICSAISIVALSAIGYILFTNGYFQAPCDTPSCMNALCQIRSKIDTNVNPCDDFYEFACGNYDRDAIIPDDKITVNIFNYFGDKIVKRLSDLLAADSNDTEIRPFRIAKDLYSACMNTTALDIADGEPLLKLLSTMGGWPMIDGTAWNEVRWDFYKTVIDMKLKGAPTKFILKAEIDISLNDTTKRILYLDSPETSVHVEFLKNGWNDTFVSNYFSFIVDLAKLLGAQDTESLQQQARDLIEFEVNLTKILIPHTNRRNPQELYNVMTLRDVQRMFPYIDWLRFIGQLYPHLKFYIDDAVAVTDIRFFENFGKLIATTDKRTIANYLMFRTSVQSIPYLSKKFRQRDTQYQALFYGEHKHQARFRDCVTLTLSEAPIALAAMYARNFFDLNAKKEALEMIEVIKSEFYNVLTSSTWMDPITKEAALGKLRRMTAYVGYPDELRNDTALEEFYDGLVVDKTDLVRSVLNNNLFMSKKWSAMYRERADKNDWRTLTNIVEINAYYDAVQNKMRIPAGIFQDHFFASNRPKYFNYAAIGFVIGHEITHGFDDLGSRFDMYGNLNNWWQNSTKQTYIERTKCMIEQYSQFKEPMMGVPLNGVTTLGENIADNGGIKIAYRAYKKWLASNKREPGLFSLDYTPEQLFWIQNAQTWCSVYRKETLLSLFKVGSLTPGKYRVLGYLQNSEDFIKDFKCPVGSKMNPTQKCQVW